MPSRSAAVRQATASSGMRSGVMAPTAPASRFTSDQVEQASELLDALPPLDPSALADAFRELPLVGLVPAIVALVTGLLLWWHGERFLRFALMVLGIVVGVPVGLALGAAFAPTLPPLAAAIVGAVALVILAAIGLKFAHVIGASAHEFRNVAICA